MDLRRLIHVAVRSPENRGTILQDTFIRAYIDDVLRSLRTQYLVDLIKPYTRMELSFLAKVSLARPPHLIGLATDVPSCSATQH